MRLAGIAGMVLLAAIAGKAEAEPVSAQSPGETVYRMEPRQPVDLDGALSVSVIRKYEVQEDAKTGRLRRVAVRSGVGSGTLRQRSAADTSERVVVPERRSPSPTAGQVDVNALVEKLGRRYNVDPELIHAVIRQESNYDPFAVSRKGARGLMQLLPETAVRFGVQDIFDPAENVQGGVKFLRFLLDRYEGDAALTLAAYNAGEGAVEKYGGVPPYEETTDYVARITALYRFQQDTVSAAEADEGPDSGDHRKITSFLEPSGLVRFETQAE